MVTVGTWQPAVTLTAVSGTRLAGTAVPVSGTVTRTYAGATTPAPGVKVQLLLVATTGAEVPLGTATTTTAGTWKGSVAPKEDGEVVARVAQVGYEATDSTGVAQQVTTRVTGSAARTARVGVAQPVSVTVSAPRALAVTLQQAGRRGLDRRRRGHDVRRRCAEGGARRADRGRADLPRRHRRRRPRGGGHVDLVHGHDVVGEEPAGRRRYSGCVTTQQGVNGLDVGRFPRRSG
ncbi:hypothetical protein GCM10025868_11970 [Angustibacter aerolatus]|uniref:Bacterial Ig domain-containing protein n=1 Tax=Angustibacter aerolatus TaxID=1162965 RepID=A0ABQ6JCN9_9ACTN|nr:hypothetical protein [Angustibacter aerolatus]GMA85947.1 hypothetical protein GCM10025868_11970 [Angustibacter aerolatus]